MLAPALKRLDVHAAREEDLAAALALVEFERQKNHWVDRIPELLQDAVLKPDGEHRACVAVRDGEVVGFGVYGIVAGTVGTGILYSVLVAPRSRRAGIGQCILSYIATELSNTGARKIFTEVPGDPYLMRYRALLISYGFMEESRVENYYRDGVPQIISRFDL
ncbi:MAG: GNAT family N-acetyltransferase [Gemmatimonadaceae bacterium]|nr:GNAT family N-acetyltransferase [Gemmatimonadaceae bacterium]